jgi:hypothetical protein
MQIQNQVGTITGTMSSMKVSVYALVAWVIVVTIALVAIGVLAFRKWRKDFTVDFASTTSGDGSINGEDSELGSNLGSVLGVNMEHNADSPTGENNQGFEDEDLDGPTEISVDYHEPPTDSTLDESETPSGTRL